jgi:hypothetical protein
MRRIEARLHGVVVPAPVPQPQPQRGHEVAQHGTRGRRAQVAPELPGENAVREVGEAVGEQQLHHADVPGDAGGAGATVRSIYHQHGTASGFRSAIPRLRLP